MTEAELRRILAENPDIQLIGGEQIVARQQPKPRAVIRYTEHDMAVAMVAQLQERIPTHPDYAYIFHVPNGGHRSRAAAGKLKAEGVKRGVLDYLWLLRRGRYAGLAVELKVGDNYPDADQRRWMQWLEHQGFCVRVVRDDPDEAVRIFDNYYNGVMV